MSNAVGLVALLLLVLPVNIFALRLTKQESMKEGQSLATESMEADSDAAFSGLLRRSMAGRNIADIKRYGYLNWYVVKDGAVVLPSLSGKYVSAKPSNISWGRIGGWNNTRSSKKTKPVIRVSLDESVAKKGTFVKIDLALRYQFGGRVQSSKSSLENKGRFLKNIRVVPHTHFSNVDGGYTGKVRVTKVQVKRIGSKSNPVAEAKLTVSVQYGGKSKSMADWYKGLFQITVQGTGRYSAQKLWSNKPDGMNKCTEQDKKIMWKMGKGNTEGTWPWFVGFCASHSSSTGKWAGHGAMIKCMKKKELSTGCSTCWADQSRFAFDGCLEHCIESWCSQKCTDCNIRNARGINPLENLQKCTGMPLHELFPLRVEDCGNNPP